MHNVPCRSHESSFQIDSTRTQYQASPVKMTLGWNKPGPFPRCERGQNMRSVHEVIKLVSLMGAAAAAALKKDSRHQIFAQNLFSAKKSIGSNVHKIKRRPELHFKQQQQQRKVYLPLRTLSFLRGDTNFIAHVSCKIRNFQLGRRRWLVQNKGIPNSCKN